MTETLNTLIDEHKLFAAGQGSGLTGGGIVSGSFQFKAMPDDDKIGARL